ncbi:MAG: hypothetical protein HGA31_04480 [Candidatus Moranbacteria bacterium]|nr:hypothetical protein [Candidatus Moranbacteria bacterium]
MIEQFLDSNKSSRMLCSLNHEPSELANIEIVKRYRDAGFAVEFRNDQREGASIELT